LRSNSGRLTASSKLAAADNGLSPRRRRLDGWGAPDWVGAPRSPRPRRPDHPPGRQRWAESPRSLAGRRRSRSSTWPGPCPGRTPPRPRACPGTGPSAVPGRDGRAVRPRCARGSCRGRPPAPPDSARWPPDRPRPAGRDPPRPSADAASHASPPAPLLGAGTPGSRAACRWSLPDVTPNPCHTT
jgi:hypothetical protein